MSSPLRHRPRSPAAAVRRSPRRGGVVASSSSPPSYAGVKRPAPVATPPEREASSSSSRPNVLSLLSAADVPPVAASPSSVSLATSSATPTKEKTPKRPRRTLEAAVVVPSGFDPVKALLLEQQVNRASRYPP